MNTKHDDLAAAEYVLGTLDEVQRLALEARMQQNPELKREVAHWQRALGYVDLAMPEEVPPEYVWPRILAELQVKKEAWPFTFFSMAGWLIAAMLGGILVFNFVQHPAETGLNQPLVVLNASDGKSQFVVFADPNRQEISVAALNVTLPDNHSMQLWAIAGKNAPVSLGLLRQDANTRMPIPNNIGLNGLTLAVSLEPKGGSKLAGPSGPVLYSGVVKRL